MKTVIVKWTGAFSYGQICNSDRKGGFYLLVGREKYERENQIKYCGITEDYFCRRLSKHHHKLSLIKENSLSIWLGEIIYPVESDRSLLELGEHCFVSFWQPPLNERKTIYYPQNAICFISQWFKQNEEPYIRRPAIIKDLPDILWWDETRWRIGKLKVGEIL